jgi:BMFP domain-containing protein YqiC
MDRNDIAGDLLEALRADASGDVLREVLARLREADRRLQARLRLLNDRDTYLQIDAAKSAVAAAIAVMEEFAAARRKG